MRNMGWEGQTKGLGLSNTDNRLSLFLLVSNSLQMVFGLKCALLLFITLEFIYPSISFLYIYIYFLTSPGNSPLLLLLQGPICGSASLQ